jgi:hypothetical protein
MEASDEAKKIELVAFADELGRFGGRARPGSHPGALPSRGFELALSVAACRFRWSLRCHSSSVYFGSVSCVMSRPRAKDA